jgi:hypothetical protein
VLSGSHASTLAQAPPAKAPGSEPLIAGGGGTPVVPPISQHFKDFGLSAVPLPFGVHGTECDGCVFSGVTLRYGGGNFQFTDFKFSGPVRVEFVGAARNTLIFVNFIRDLAASQLPKKPSPNAPITQLATIKQTMTGTFGTD